MDPPDLGKHAAVRQAEAEAEEPQAELQEVQEGGGWRGGVEETSTRMLGVMRKNLSILNMSLFRDTVLSQRVKSEDKFRKLGVIFCSLTKNCFRKL